MNLQTPSTFTSVHSLGGWLLAGLRLRLPGKFQGFLAVCQRKAQASSYRFGSASPLPLRRALAWLAPVLQAGRFLLASGPNPSLKRIGLRPTAYLVR